MPFTNYGTANIAQGTLQAGISGSATSVILWTGQGALFPTAWECPFFIKIENLDTALNGYRVLKREIVKVTNRASDTLTIVRSAGTCPPDYQTLSQGTTAFSFSAGDTVTQILTAEQLRELATHKVNREDYQNQTAIYAADSGAANAYVITLTPAPTAYAAGQCFTFKAANTNSGVSTINVNGLGVKTIKKNVSASLASGDITAGQICVVEYDGTNFQLTSNTPATIPVETLVMWEGCAQGDAIAEESIYPTLITDSQISFGNASATQYHAVRMVGNGVAMTTIFAGLKKVWSPADNCIIAIQADSAGSPSGTDLATATIAGGTITTTSAEYNPTLSGSVTPTDKIAYWVVFRRSGALDASNYYQIAVHTDDTVGFPYKTNNAGAWSGNTLTESTTVCGAGFYPKLAVRANATTYKFANVFWFAPAALAVLANIAKSVSNIYSGLSALKPGKQYYLTNTSGAVSLTAGTNTTIAGTAQSGTTIKVEDTKRLIAQFTVQINAAVATAYSAAYYLPKWALAYFYTAIANGWTNWASLQYSLDNWATWVDSLITAWASTWSGAVTGATVLAQVPWVWVRGKLTVTTAGSSTHTAYYNLYTK